MAIIVCATRGGEGSRAVQLAAIERARRAGDTLIFLFVADTTFQEDVEETLRAAVQEEILWMGSAMLQVARRRAEARALEVQLAIRKGEVRKQIIQFLQEVNAARLFLGAPRGTTATVFGDDAIEVFAQSIKKATGVDVEVVRPEFQP